MRKIDITGCRSSVILNRYKADVLIMEEITEEQEKEIDTRGELDEIFYITKKGIRINAKDIFLYGEINLNSKDDLRLLNKSDIVTQEANYAANIPSDFDYETGIVTSNKDNRFLCHDTWNKLDWFKYNHCLLGKPKRIIIYRINKIHVKRNRSTRKLRWCDNC